MPIDPEEVTRRHAGALPELLGIRFVEASPERLVAELTIRDDLRTIGGALHGGTIMALADTVGATATVLNLPPGATTTTLESRSYAQRSTSALRGPRLTRSPTSHSVSRPGAKSISASRRCRLAKQPCTSPIA